MTWKPETYRPIIVVCTGRTGSSTVARLLQENLGIKMVAQNFIQPDSWNPQGYYEDRQVKLAIKQMMYSKWPPKSAAHHLFEHYGHGVEPWGFKLQLLGPMPDGVLQAFNPYRVIACVRERQQTITSIASWRRMNLGYNEAALQYDARNEAMKQMLHGFAALWLDFSQPRRESELLETMREFIGATERVGG